jgi:hypothetical protein
MDREHYEDWARECLSWCEAFGIDFVDLPDLWNEFSVAAYRAMMGAKEAAELLDKLRDLARTCPIPGFKVSVSVDRTHGLG